MFACVFFNSLQRETPQNDTHFLCPNIKQIQRQGRPQELHTHKRNAPNEAVNKTNKYKAIQNVTQHSELQITTRPQ